MGKKGKKGKKDASSDASSGGAAAAAPPAAIVPPPNMAIKDWLEALNPAFSMYVEQFHSRAMHSSECTSLEGSPSNFRLG